MTGLLSHPQFWEFVSIPLVAAFVGWSTNWLAIQMMFYPLKFVGYKPLFLGWQGVIPSKAEKMARVVVQKGLRSLTNIAEVYDHIDRSKLTLELVQVINARLEPYIDDIMTAEYAALWNNLPPSFKDIVYTSVRKQLPQRVEQIVEDLGDHIEDLFDLEAMVVEILINNKMLLNRIFQEAGEQEFKFIINSGIYLGFLFGLIQMACWYVYPVWWTLPAFGLLVGYVTNDIALRIIFKPLHPVKIGPIVLQGLFLKRQKEVARILCRITTQEVITISNILYAMLTGPKKERTRQLIQSRIREAIDESVSTGFGTGNPMFSSLAATPNYVDLKVRATDLAMVMATEEVRTNMAFSQEQANRIEELLRSRMEMLTPAEFQDVLRPAFQEDEWKLIVLGGVLGAVAGFIQLITVFDWGGL